MRKYLIKNELLDANFFLVVGSDKECTKFLNKIDLDRKERWESDNDPDVYGQYIRLNKTLKKYNCRRLIHVVKFDKTPFSLGILVHEIQHYVNDVILNKGLKNTRGDEETSAYLSEFTFKECLKALKY